MPISTMPGWPRRYSGSTAPCASPNAGATMYRTENSPPSPAVKLEPEETVVFSWIEWPSREVRDVGMQKVMEDPRLKQDSNPMPFDGKRMIYGGFRMVVDE